MKFKTKEKLLNVGNLVASFIFLYAAFLAYKQQNYIFLFLCIIASIVITFCWYKLNKSLNSIED